MVYYKLCYIDVFFIHYNYYYYYCNFFFLVNDGSGKLPAYRGLVDAVRSIVRTDGIKGLYQVR